MKIYTRTGDDGTTGLLGNSRVSKHHPRIEAYGSLDETNAHVGLMLAYLPPEAESARGWIDQIQSDLFLVGTLLATPSGAAARVDLSDARILFLEETIDKMEGALKPLKNFILPRGVPSAAASHVARSVCRRAERRIVELAEQETVPTVVIKYVNRLSDWLFVFARWVNLQGAGAETAWINPAKGAANASEDEAPGPDRLSATLQKLEEEKKARQTLFERASDTMQKKKDAADRLFKANVDQIQKDGGKVEKPIRDFDLD